MQNLDHLHIIIILVILLGIALAVIVFLTMNSKPSTASYIQKWNVWQDASIRIETEFKKYQIRNIEVHLLLNGDEVDLKDDSMSVVLGDYYIDIYRNNTSSIHRHELEHCQVQITITH